MSSAPTKVPVTMVINWIGLWTIVRREIQRLFRVPIQAFLAPWISALMFIFIFGYVVGPRIASIGGHKYLEFVLPGVLLFVLVLGFPVIITVINSFCPVWSAGVTKLLAVKTQPLPRVFTR